MGFGLTYDRRGEGGGCDVDWGGGGFKGAGGVVWHNWHVTNVKVLGLIAPRRFPMQDMSVYDIFTLSLKFERIVHKPNYPIYSGNAAGFFFTYSESCCK